MLIVAAPTSAACGVARKSVAPPLLTIAIPTYNRAASLQRLLECLSSQDDIQLVQVLVSDNGSTDDTRNIVNEFVDRFEPKIKSVGFPSNRGFDANYLNCLN